MIIFIFTLLIVNSFEDEIDQKIGSFVETAVQKGVKGPIAIRNLYCKKSKDSLIVEQIRMKLINKITHEEIQLLGDEAGRNIVLEQIEEEMKRRDFYKEDVGKNLGKFQNAKLVICGTLTEEKELMNLDLVIIEVKSGTTKYGDRIEFHSPSYFVRTEREKRTKIIALICLASVVSLTAATLIITKTKKKRKMQQLPQIIMDAKQLMEVGEYKKAEELIRKGLVIRPNDITLLSLKNELAMVAGKDLSFSEEAWCLYNEGKRLKELGLLKECYDVIHKAVHKSPHSPEIVSYYQEIKNALLDYYIKKAKAFKQQAETNRTTYSTVEEVIKEIEKIEPDNIEAKTLLDEILNEKNTNTIMNEAKLFMTDGKFDLAREKLKNIANWQFNHKIVVLLETIDEKEKIVVDLLKQSEQLLREGRPTAVRTSLNEFIKKEGPIPQVKAALSKIENIKTLKDFILSSESDKIYFLTGRVLEIGRSQECDIVVNDEMKKVSRKHCQIYAEGNKIKMKDLDSVNRTFLNGKEIEDTELKEKGEISLGLEKKILFSLNKKGTQIDNLYCYVSEQKAKYLWLFNKVGIGMEKNSFNIESMPLFFVTYNNGNFFIRAIRRKEVYLNKKEIEDQFPLALGDEIEVRKFKFYILPIEKEENE